MPLKLAIGCSTHLFSEGLEKLLEDERDISVVGIFNGGKSGAQDMGDILKLGPDVILADFTADFNILSRLPEDAVAGNQLKVLLIGDRSLRLVSDRQLKDLILKGVVGILPPSADADLLKKALKAVFSGELWIDRNTLMKILTCLKQPEKAVGLAKREREIVSHICQGYRNKEIAQKLKISEQTVKSHCTRIYRKLGVSDRLQLALYSYKIWPDSSASQQSR
jgi:DNA-binding NarL/FixJ family response regulator